MWIKSYERGISKRGIMMFECVRCTREVDNEESYLLNREKYCRACMNTIKNDPDYQWIVSRAFVMGRLENIEN